MEDKSSLVENCFDTMPNSVANDDAFQTFVSLAAGFTLSKKADIVEEKIEYPEFGPRRVNGVNMKLIKE